MEAVLTPSTKEVRAAWEKRAIPLLYPSDMVLPKQNPVYPPRDQHTPHLKILVDEMQSVAREDPQAQW